MEQKIKKPKHQDLADYLSVSLQAVRQYPKLKLNLMIQGLWKMKLDAVKIKNEEEN